MVEATTSHFWNPPSGGNCAILNPRWKITEEKQGKIVYGEFIFIAASKSIIQVQRGTIFTMLSNSFDVSGSVSWGLSNLTSQIIFSLTFHDPKQQISGLKRKPSSTCSTSHPLEGRNQENYRTSVLQVREPGPGLAAVQTNTSHCVLAPPHWNLSVKLIRPLSQNKTLRIPSSSPIPSHGCQIKYRMPDWI